MRRSAAHPFKEPSMHRKRLWPFAALALGACGVQQLDVEAPPQEEVLASTEHALELKVKEAFGDDARVAHTLSQQGKLVVSVAQEDAATDADSLPPVGLAVFEPKSGELNVL